MQSTTARWCALPNQIRQARPRWGLRAAAQSPGLPPQQQTAAILRERKGRGGKTVTIIRELQLTPEDLQALARQLKQLCGSGGTIKDSAIEIQGDHRQKISDRLRALGYKTKFIGG
jgi:translation initiation factor 1